jgi:hypothetical protein
MVPILLPWRTVTKGGAGVGTAFLVVEPGFVYGASRVFDLWGHLDIYNISPEPGIADKLAFRSDWRAVGHYLHSAMAAYDKSRSSSQLDLFTGAGRGAQHATGR